MRSASTPRPSRCKCMQLAVGILSVSSLSLACQQALAQQAQQGPIEEIQVTGSFISRPADRPQPVSVIDNQEIEANQRDSVVQVIRDMPQISNANVTANGLNPTNSIDLRALGDRSTLVLLNGQRQTIDGNGLSNVDVNNLAPSIMIQRVELLLDGASALYGSDAVAGVANFITRDDFEGSEVRLSSQWAEAQTSVPETGLSGIWGVQGEKNGIVAALEWRNRSDVMEAEDIRSVDRLAEGLKTAFYNPGSFLAAGDGFYPDPLCGSTEIGGNGANDYTNEAGFVGGPFCRGLLTWRRTLIPETETLTGMAVVTHHFDSDKVNDLRVELSYAKAVMHRHEGTGLPFLALSSYNPVLPANNPGVIDAHQRDPNFPLTDFTSVFSRLKAPVEGPVVQTTKQWTYRTAASVDGIFGDGNWDWRVTGTFSQNDQFSQDVDVIADRLVRALQGYGGPDCKWNDVLGAAASGLQPGVGSCQWYNPFASRLLAQPGDPTYNDPDLVEWIQWGESPLGNAELYTLEGLVTGDLWEMGGGATGFAVGAQYRRQVLEVHTDPIQKDGGFAFAPQVVYNWGSDRDTNAFFAELVMYPTDSFELDLAARYEETLSKSSTNPKLSMLWTPTDNVYLRASAGSSFRVASEFQLFGTGEGFGSVYPLGGEVTQARGLNVGNPNLNPEKSDNWTLGVTWDATDNLTFEATWWDYDFKDLVTATDATDMLLADIADGYIDDMAAHPLFPGRPNEVCEITGRWDPNSGDPLPAGCVTGFDIRIFNNQFINQDSVATNGLDLTIDWNTDLSGGGQVGTRLTSTYVNSYQGTGVNGNLVEVVGTDGFGVAGIETNPQVRANVIQTYRKGNNYLRATVRYTQGTKVTNPDPNVQNTSDSSYTQLDLNYTRTLPGLNDSSFTIAILNVADREPPLVANGLLTSNSSLYDPRGRIWRAGFDYNFGQ
jgi:iron complex outermembrane receptor protein